MNLRFNYVFFATIWGLLMAAHEEAAVAAGDLIVAIGGLVVERGGLVQIAGHLFQLGIGKGAAHTGGLIGFSLGGMAISANFGVDASRNLRLSGLLFGAGAKND